ncbi:MAG: ABC transporter ATP-binding protein [Alphaproteobacteria bacterium]|jgi:ABC-2 type transport system ATP-binding protein|nr:ABC transporter ATP-binding protein [Alphaproteobacteria bacterium]
MTDALLVQHLSKRFGTRQAVDNVSFALNIGDVLGFLGPNGAGKSTTMRMLTGFLPPDNGTIAVFGQDLQKSTQAVQTLIGYVPEGAPLYGDMTVYEFLQFICAARGVLKSRRALALYDAAEKTALHEVLDQRIETLSKGYKRRAALASALVHNPPLLILDEPTDGLDPNQKHTMRALIKALSAEKAILISTHILEEVDAVCTRALILAEGRVRYLGTAAGLRTAADVPQPARLEDVFRSLTQIQPPMQQRSAA